MFKRLLSVVLILAQTVSPTFAFSLSDGRYYFRFKDADVTPVEVTDPEGQSKDITAYYIGGLNSAFSEKLPMKPEWQDDLWRITGGSLPKGLTFDAATLTFVGTPTEVISDAVVELTGYDANNADVATAEAHFSIYQLPDQVVDVDFYDHTGKYNSHALALPQGVVIQGDPKLLSSSPAGITYNARYFEGTATKAGTYPVLAIGYDFVGKAVVAFKGKYTVEDGPTFSLKVEDDLKKLITSDYWGCSVNNPCALWNYAATAKVGYSISDPAKIKYSAEVADGGKLPGTLQFADGPYALAKLGRTYTQFDQATVRYKAIDTDGTVGYSNWFKIGSVGATELCQPYGGLSSISLNGVVGANFFGSGYAIPRGSDSNQKLFSIVAGQLPGGLTLSSDTGVIGGKPLATGQQTGVRIQVSYPSNPASTPLVCGPYNFAIAPAQVSFTYNNLKDDYRVGENIDVSFTYGGGIIGTPKITMNADATLPTGVSFDSTTNKLTGTVNQSGQFNATFTLTNGDGYRYSSGLAFTGHTNVHINSVPAETSVKQYDSQPSIFGFSIDPTTIITPGTEQYSIVNGPLPDGIVLNSTTMAISGGTRLPVNRYGPYRIQVVDSSGQSDETNDFYINVTQRDGLVAGATVDPLTFSVNLPDSGQKPFSVTQPPLAKDLLPLSYVLSPTTLPTGLSFDPSTGVISGTAKMVGSSPGYTVTVNETGPDNLSAVSAPFTIVVKSPTDIPTQALAKLQGNVTGPNISSVSPSAALNAIKDTIVGFEEGVVFDDVTPSVPGLAFDKATGIISGQATAQFDGNVTIKYHDVANRSGSLILPVSIYPYPELTSSQETYTLPRLSDASAFNIKAQPNAGFYSGVTYSLDPSSDSLPTGLSLTTGAITGATTDPVNTTRNIVVRAVSNANGIVVKHSFTLTVVNRNSMSLDIKPDDKIWFWIDQSTGVLKNRQWFTDPVQPTGSFVAPVTWSLVGDAPDWMGISSNGQLSGTPNRLGEWEVTVQAQDAEGNIATDTVTVKSSLSGNVAIAPGAQTLTVRSGETFATATQIVTNVVTPYSWVQSSSKPSGLSFDDKTGVYTGHIDVAGKTSWTLDIDDADSRTLSNPTEFNVTVVAPLDIPAARSVANGAQYDANRPIKLVFSPAVNVLGKVTYAVTGDVPGTLYYRVYPNDDVTQLATYISTSGDVVSRQVPGQSLTDIESSLAPDHMIFDTVALTLTGIPSRSGTFQIGIFATDDYQDAAYKVNPSDLTRVSYNSKQSAMSSVTVAPAPDLQVANSVDNETVAQYTGQPTLVSNVSNDAYGRGVVWTSVASALPTGIAAVKGLQSLSYAGYPTVQGTWNNIVWQAKDMAGRTVATNPISFTVGTRQSLQLVASQPVPRMVEVNKDDANLSVTAKNTPNGNSIGTSNWAISGVDKLPPGVTYTVSDDGYHFAGIATKLGSYTGITISATDSLGAKATLGLTFYVFSSSDPIVLNVFNITTKPGYPIEMQPPFAATALSTDNTYGAIRFYSNDLPSIAGISLNSTTGYLDGKLSTAQQVTFDLFVTDETNRVTSKPVNVNVIPNLRLIVPTQVAAEQGKVVSQSLGTDYVLGTVSYAKGSGNWPVGFVVNPVSGVISSNYTDPTSGVTTTNVVAEAKTYSGLTIVGTDTFGTYTDVQSSNAFSIVVSPTTKTPVISNVANNKMVYGVVGTTAAGFTPTVKANDGSAWNYGGTVYSLNTDLSSYGLSFDTTTGKISGTPTKAVIIDSLVMTVTSSRGDSSSTTPFWFGIAPAGNIVADSTQVATYTTRRQDSFTSNAPIFTNTIGTLSYSLTSTNSGLAINSSTGVVSYNNVPLGANDEVTYTYTVTVSDLFGRTGSLPVTWKVISAPAVTVGTASLTVVSAQAVASLNPGIAKGVYGTASYTVSGLPTGLSVDPTTGAISGTLPNTYANGQTFAVTLTLTDSYDSKKATTTYQIVVVNGSTTWRFTADTVKLHSSGRYLCLAELRWLSNGVDITSQISSITTDSLIDATKNPQQLIDGVIAKTYASTYCSGGANSTALYSADRYVEVVFTTPVDVTSVAITDRGDGSDTAYPLTWHVSTMKDGVGTTIWSDAKSAWGQLVTVVSKKPGT
jgi:hypothetical protein